MTPSVEDIPLAAILKTSRRSEVILTMQAFYADLDGRIAEQGSTCRMCGKCCNFGSFGHRLYVTTLETAYYLAGNGPPPPITGDVCPHLFDEKCHARHRRTLACRVFYCDPKYKDSQGPLIEEYHARLHALHAEFQVPYIYIDWITMLQVLNMRERKNTQVSNNSL